MQHRSQSGIGGLEGRLLKDGDRLPIGKSKRDSMEAQGVKQLLWGNRIRALPGPEYHEFDRASQDAFWRSPWQLSSQSNRMGYRLQGQILKRTSIANCYLTVCYRAWCRCHITGSRLC